LNDGAVYAGRVCPSRHVARMNTLTLARRKARVKPDISMVQV